MPAFTEYGTFYLCLACTHPIQYILLMPGMYSPDTVHVTYAWHVLTQYSTSYLCLTCIHSIQYIPLMPGMYLPNTVHPPDAGHAELLCLFLKNMFRVMIGNLTRLAHQSSIFEFISCHLLVQRFQAEQKAAMSKPVNSKVMHSYQITDKSSWLWVVYTSQAYHSLPHDSQ